MHTIRLLIGIDVLHMHVTLELYRLLGIGYSQICQATKIANRVWDSAAQTVVEQRPTHGVG